MRDVFKFLVLPLTLFWVWMLCITLLKDMEVPILVHVVSVPSLTEQGQPFTSDLLGNRCTGQLTLEARLEIERVVEGETRGGSYEGKLWVATCIYNTMNYYDESIFEVIQSGCYDGYNEDVQPDTQAAVYRVFDLNSPVHSNVMYFYAPSICESAWHESLHFVHEVDGHRFFEIEDLED